MHSAGDDGGCIAGETRAGSVVDGIAVVTDEHFGCGWQFYGKLTFAELVH